MQLLAVVVAFVGAMLLTAGINWLGFPRVRVDETTHWTEHARKLFPIRRTSALNIWLLPAISGMSMKVVFREDLESWCLILALVAGLAGAVIGTYPLDKKVFPQFTFNNWLRYVLAFSLLRVGVWGLLLVAGILMPQEFSWRPVVLGFGILGFLIALNFGLWIWLMRISGLISRVKDSEPIAEIVHRMVTEMQVSCRNTWLLKSPMGYAAALPATHELIFSEGLLNSHPPEELAAICAHECAHLSESRQTLVARIARSLAFYPFIFIRPMVHAFDGLGLLMVYLPFVFVIAFSRTLSRRMEERADAMAKKNTPDSGAYARALERLYRNNKMPAVMHESRLPHPHLYDRMLAAGVTPDYPRPSAPRSFSWSTGILIFLLVSLFVIVVSRQ